MQAYRKQCWQCLCVAAVLGCSVLPNVRTTHGATMNVVQDRSSRTPLQMEIEKQTMRLSSAEVEERRDAITQLGSMHHPQASRAAIAGLRDPTPIVRATSAAAILSLPAEESAASLIPLLNDKDEFVRREAAYALGATRSRTAVPFLIERLVKDKKDEVRGAAAVALGLISDVTSVPALSAVLSPALATVAKGKKPKQEKDPFLLRSAARSLGQIGSREALPILITILQDEKSEDDVRREAAIALGQIGDAAALPALEGAIISRDPHLSHAAHQASRRIRRSNSL
ncbi:MAG: HEAT repeat domain-containing protein [Acidobacteriota bacterium]|nr:HEAT repeat domain-containing protein [Acidobacteriota bacterium]